MRKTAFTVHNGQEVEIYVEKLKHGFGIWVVGLVKGHRMILDHHLTHDDLEALLEYGRPGDLVWNDAARSDIPAEKHQNAIEMEGTIKRRVFWDYDDSTLDEMEEVARRAAGLPRWSGTHRSVTQHLGSLAILAADKKGMNEAKRALYGRWTDGVVTLDFMPDHKLGWACTDRYHPLNIGDPTHRYAPDWWNFAMWGIALLNNEHKCGTTVDVLWVNEQELHLSGSHPHRMADVFQRIGQREEIAIQEPEPAATKPKKLRRFAGVATPLLRQLEQAIAQGNPFLAERMKPGLSESDIRAALTEANVEGEIEPIIQIYSWRNGIEWDDDVTMGEASLFPEQVYWLLDLEEAIHTFVSINDAAETLRELFLDTEAEDLFSKFRGQLFPLLSDGGGGTIAVDLTSGVRNRVFEVEFESEEPVRQAYDSFEEFLADAIRANQVQR